MSDNKQSYLPTIVAVVLVGLARVLTHGSERAYWTFVGAVMLVSGLVWLAAYWMKERAIRFLLRLDAEGRRLALADITDHDVRREITQGLDEDPIPEAMPPVERFPFPRRMRRALTFTYVGGTLVAVGGATLAALASSRDLQVAGSTTALVAALATIAWGWRRTKLLATSIEISPFAISEVWPDGSRRTMLWRDVWWLRNRPRLGRLEVLGPDQRTGIRVHYDRVAFKRAAELVVDYGGFGSPTG